MKLIALLYARFKCNLSVSTALKSIDNATRTLNAVKLQTMVARGDLPNGVYDWLIALRKADIAIPGKNPRPM